MIASLVLLLLAPQEAGLDEEQFLRDQSLHNPRVAIVGDHLITFGDIMNEWDLMRILDPQRYGEDPTETAQRELRRSIVEDWLWIDHARTFEQYREWATDELLNRFGSRAFPDVWDDPPREAFRPILRRWAETRHAKEAVLLSDADVQRAIKVRPEELRDYYRENPDQFRWPEQVRLGRTIISKAVHGTRARTLSEEVRSLVVGGLTLDEAAQEVAPGSYQDMNWIAPEDSGLRPEILDFVAAASIREVSEILELGQSFHLYELQDRTPPRKESFEDASPRLQNILRQLRLQEFEKRYLVLKVMPKSYFEPQELFDEELERFGYQRRR